MRRMWDLESGSSLSSQPSFHIASVCGLGKITFPVSAIILHVQERVNAVLPPQRIMQEN